MSEKLTITIKSTGDKKYEVAILPSDLISTLKQEVAKVAAVPAESQRLIHSGKVLKDDQTVESYKIQTGQTIHLVGARKASEPAPAAATIPVGLAAGQGNSPLNDLTSARYAGYGAQMPDLSLMIDESGLPSESHLEQIMSDPGFGASMQSMLNNPQMLDMMMQQNPMMQGMDRDQVRQMMLSPIVQNMLSNPQMMRSMMRMQAGGMGNAGNFPMPGNAGTFSLAEGTPDALAHAQAAGLAASPANPFAALLGPNASSDPFQILNQLGISIPQEMLARGPAAVADNTPPEVKYEAQLKQLNDMGFFEFESNVQALRRSGGSVQGALEHLLS